MIFCLCDKIKLTVFFGSLSGRSNYLIGPYVCMIL